MISVFHNYFPEPQYQQPESAPKISKYAWGEDYHKVLKRKLYQLLEFIQSNSGAINARVFTDSAPVLERVWAARAGLGWVGKNSLLLSKKQGSFFFLGELLVDLKLPPDPPVTDHCGSCTACLDACPTEAIIQPFVIDSNRCISYLTIEFREALDPAFKPHMDGWAFGCDICQEVCPWNRFSKPHAEPRFAPHPDLLTMTQKDWKPFSAYLATRRLPAPDSTASGATWPF